MTTQHDYTTTPLRHRTRLEKVLLPQLNPAGHFHQDDLGRVVQVLGDPAGDVEVGGRPEELAHAVNLNRREGGWLKRRIVSEGCGWRGVDGNTGGRGGRVAGGRGVGGRCGREAIVGEAGGARRYILSVLE